MQHPNLFFTKYDAETFRERIKTDEKLRARYEANVAKAEEYLTDYGFIVDTAEDGIIAVEKMKNAKEE